MREKLSALIQEAEIPMMNGKQLVGIYALDEIGANALADHMIANGVTVQRWIPVGERLPEVEGSYLVCSKTDKVYHAHWYPEKKYHEGYTRKAKWSHPNVTHWMPLPDAPKEVE